MNWLYYVLMVAAAVLSIAAAVAALILLIVNRNQRRMLQKYVAMRTHGLHVRVARLESLWDSKSACRPTADGSIQRIEARRR